MVHDTNDIRKRLIELAEPVCADSGYELVDLRYQSDQGAWVVRVFIDGEGEKNGAISFDDCETISRELSAIFDVEDPIQGAYNLEVSSPGVERPLRTVAHFRRYVGDEVKVSLHEGVSGRRNFRGTVRAVADDGSSVDLEVDGKSFTLPLQDLRSAKLVVDWDSLLKRDGSERKRHTAS